MTKRRRKFWICRGRSFVHKVLKTCILCRKFEGPSYQYPATPPVTKLRLNDTHAFFTTGVDNFEPLYVKPIFIMTKGSPTIFKLWMTLYICASSRGIMLDLVPRLDSKSFIKSFQWFVGWLSCPSYVISDGSSNFVASETQAFANG